MEVPLDAALRDSPSCNCRDVAGDLQGRPMARPGRSAVGQTRRRRREKSVATATAHNPMPAAVATSGRDSRLLRSITPPNPQADAAA
jgi:hypothetical protein